MAVLSAEIRKWLDSRSAEERQGVLSYLTAEALSEQPNGLAVENEKEEPIGYVVASRESANMLGYVDPEMAAEIRRRIANPSDKFMTLEELLEKVEDHFKAEAATDLENLQAVRC